MTQAASQTAGKPVGKGDGKSGGNNAGATDAGSATSASATTLEQVTAQIQASAQPPALQPPTSQISINTAANTAGAHTVDAADNDASQAPATTAQSAGTSGQTGTPAGQTLPGPQNTRTAAQVPGPQAVNALAGQPIVLQPVAPLDQASDAAQNSVSSNPPPTPHETNSVQPNSAPSAQAQPTVPQTPTAMDPAKAANSSDKNAKRKSDGTSTNGAGSSSPQQTGTQAQPAVQPDASQISNASTAAQIAAAANGDDRVDDEPGIEAAGSASLATNGLDKAQASQDAQNGQATRNVQAGLAGRQQSTQPQASGQAATSQTAGGADSATTQDGGTNPAEADLFVKPWQAKPQSGNADATANTGQTASADDVKQAATQGLAASNAPLSKPADNANLTILATPQTQQSQAQVRPQSPRPCRFPQRLPTSRHWRWKSPQGRKAAPSSSISASIRRNLAASMCGFPSTPAARPARILPPTSPRHSILLQKDAPALTQALRDAGLNVSQNGLNFSLRQQQRQMRRANGNQSRGGNGRASTLTATSSMDAASAGAAYQRPGRRTARHPCLRKTHMSIGSTTPTTTPTTPRPVRRRRPTPMAPPRAATPATSCRAISTPSCSCSPPSCRTRIPPARWTPTSSPSSWSNTARSSSRSTPTPICRP